MKIEFVYTPTADPTCPWGSLYMLKGFLDNETDYRTTVRDLNIEWLLYLFDPERIEACRDRLNERIRQFEAKNELSAFEQLEYLAAIEPYEFPDASDVTEALAIFRDPQKFYDYDRYFDAVYAIKRWTRAMSRLTYPGGFTNLCRYTFGPFMNPSSAEDLSTDPSDRELGYFGEFLKERYFPRLAEDLPDVIGISIPFRFQFWHSFYFARMVKRHFPTVRLVVGGTALQIQKHAKLGGKPNALTPVFKTFDAVIVGEGERPLLETLKAWDAGDAIPTEVTLDPKGPGPIVRNAIPNVLTVEAGGSKIIQSAEIKYHDLNEIHPPNYAEVDWSTYLAPEPVLTYSPTRGCYWDRCAFCESGLANNRPTSPSRERDYDLVLADLKELRKVGRHIYWAVDAIRPGWLLELSRRMRSTDLDIRWGAEVRFDRKYTEADVAALRDGGCLALSVGIESGSNRILDLIDKGADIDRYSLILERMRAHGIAVYPMTFIGFPTETVEEAQQTVAFLTANRGNFAFLTMPATFYLEGHSFVARRPWQYGIRRIHPFKNLDAANGWYWEGPLTWDLDEQQQLMAALTDMSDQIMGFLDRPFLGGIDTPHTNFYVERFGLDAVRTANGVFRKRLGEVEPADKRFQVESPFDLACMRDTVWRFVESLQDAYAGYNCATRRVSHGCLAALPAVGREAPRSQSLELGCLTPVTQWLDINFSRDQARIEPMYTQVRPSHSGTARPAVAPRPSAPSTVRTPALG
jgi:radical SAM superfamily enzyme YgiQ (UPF0313 family)